MSSESNESTGSTPVTHPLALIHAVAHEGHIAVNQTSRTVRRLYHLRASPKRRV